MSSWLDMHKAFSGLLGNRIHAVRVEIESLKRALSDLGFQIFVIDGSKIVDAKSFFDEVAWTLNFPAYCGHNWNAWNDCLNDFGESLSTDRIAIVWNRADQTFAADVQIFLEAVFDLSSLALGVALGQMQHPKEGIGPKQMELFLVGEEDGFVTLELGEMSSN